MNENTAGVLKFVFVTGKFNDIFLFFFFCFFYARVDSIKTDESVGSLF